MQLQKKKRTVCEIVREHDSKIVFPTRGAPIQVPMPMIVVTNGTTTKADQGDGILFQIADRVLVATLDQIRMVQIKTISGPIVKVELDLNRW